MPYWKIGPIEGSPMGQDDPAAGTFTVLKTTTDPVDEQGVGGSGYNDGRFLKLTAFNANTVMKADADNTPVALVIAEQTLLGRITSGNITALTATQIRTLLNVQDGASADQTGAEIKSLYEGEADTNAYTDSEKTKLAGVATSANNYSHPNHSGDVTSAGDGAQTIANDAVTYAKMQNISATDKLLGRSTAGAGDTEEIPCTAFARTILDDVDAGAVRTTTNSAKSGTNADITSMTGLNDDGIPASKVTGATETAEGVIEKATTTECVTGTDTDRAVTPAGLTSRIASPSEIGGTLPDKVNASEVELNNDAYIKGKNYAGTGVVNMLKVNTDNEIDVGGTLKLGDSFEIVEDAGAITLLNFPISSSAVVGSEQSITFKIGGVNVFTIGGFADGAGSVNNVFIKNHETICGEGYFYNNSVATVMETADTPIAMFGVTEGICNGVVFDVGSTGAITAFADGGSGKVNVSSAAHGLSTGDIITIRGTTNYNGVFEITVIDAGSFSIVDTWATNDGASDWIKPDSLNIPTGLGGIYNIAGHISMSPSSAGIITWMMYNKTSPLVKSVVERKYPVNDLGGGAYSFLSELADNSKIWVSVSSNNTSDITFKHGGMRIHKY